MVESSLIQSFTSSYIRLQQSLEEENTLYKTFYRRLINSDVRIAKLFNEIEFQRQYSMLNNAIFIFYTCKVTGVPVSEITKIRNIHMNLNLEIADFQIWKKCLLDTIQDLDQEFNGSIRQAWEVVIDTCINYIVTGTDE